MEKAELDQLRQSLAALQIDLDIEAALQGLNAFRMVLSTPGCRVEAKDIGMALALKLRTNSGYKPTWCYKPDQRYSPFLHVLWLLLLWMLREAAPPGCLCHTGRINRFFLCGQRSPQPQDMPVFSSVQSLKTLSFYIYNLFGTLSIGGGEGPCNNAK